MDTHRYGYYQICVRVHKVTGS